MAKKTGREKYIRRMVTLEPRDFQAVWAYAREKGLGGKGFSTALRLIIREWQFLRRGGAWEMPPGGPPGGPPGKSGPSGNSGACR